jgi:hypothetical protein
MNAGPFQGQSGRLGNGNGIGIGSSRHQLQRSSQPSDFQASRLANYQMFDTAPKTICLFAFI